MSSSAQWDPAALTRLQGKWKLELLYAMAGGAVRWKDLIHSLPDAAPNVLTRQLRQLEADHLVVRRVISKEPPQTVEYELSGEGKKLRPILRELRQRGPCMPQAHGPVPDFSAASRVLSGRWILPILELLTEPLRFGSIQQQLTGLSRSVLAAQLRELCEMGLLRQHRHTCFPPCVEYALTDEGRALLGILSKLPEALS